MRKMGILFSVGLLGGLLLGACSATGTTAVKTATDSDNQEVVSTYDVTNTTTTEQVTKVAPGTPPQGTPGAGAGAPPNDGTPPGGGTPPSGNPQNGNTPPSGGIGPGGNGSSSVDDGLATATGTYTLDGQVDTLSGETIEATAEDQSAVYAINGANLSLNDVTINTSGDSSSSDNSSFYGLNAGVLAASTSTIQMSGGSITTSGSGANGAFATGEDSTVNLTNMTISATGGGAHGVMATRGAQINLENVDITTTGRSSAPIATDRGGGTITVIGGTLNTSGEGSPCYYSTGVLDISDNTCISTGTESAVIEGANSIILNDSELTSIAAGSKGVMIYQSFSGDAQGSDGVFTMTGGSIAHLANDGPLFYVTNTNGYITLSGVEVNAASGVLLRAEGNDRWGTQGKNGGTAYFTADEQDLTGDFLADSISNMNITLQNNSVLNGAINVENVAKSAALTLDGSSTWNVTEDSYLSCLTDTAGISGTAVSNISGNGHTVYYNAAGCPALNSQTYSLNNGGTLQPES